MKIEFCPRQNFEILIIYKPSLGHVRPDRYCCFDVYWTQTDRRIDRQAYIEAMMMFILHNFTPFL